MPAIMMLSSFATLHSVANRYPLSEDYKITRLRLKA